MDHVSPFHIIEAKSDTLVPVIISVPHAGTWFPPEERHMYKPHILQHPPDTDWFVDQIYDFAPQLGATMIKSNISRYIIDLNRPADGTQLYQDGRRNPGLIPWHTFAGEDVYQSAVDSFSLKSKRLSLFYEPYHEALGRLLKQRVEKFGRCLLIDAHSIKRHVPNIRQEAFPDIIIGTNQGKSCDSRLAELAQNILQAKYQVTLNDPFQGGHITRKFGRPEVGVHCIQIEMSQDLYLDESTDTLISQHSELKQQLLAMTKALSASIFEL